MSYRGEVLVAIINDLSDFDIFQKKHWYRIPASSVEKWLKSFWPPQWIAFYQTKAFGVEAHSISYYARVRHFRQLLRWQLLPKDIHNKNSHELYYQIFLEPLQRLPAPIIS